MIILNESIEKVLLDIKKNAELLGKELDIDEVICDLKNKLIDYTIQGDLIYDNIKTKGLNIKFISNEKSFIFDKYIQSISYNKKNKKFTVTRFNQQKETKEVILADMSIDVKTLFELFNI